MATVAAAAAPAIQESPEALARMSESIIGERNPRGIPAAVFVVRSLCELSVCVVINALLRDVAFVDLVNL